MKVIFDTILFIVLWFSFAFIPQLIYISTLEISKRRRILCYIGSILMGPMVYFFVTPGASSVMVGFTNSWFSSLMISPPIYWIVTMAILGLLCMGLFMYVLYLAWYKAPKEILKEIHD